MSGQQPKSWRDAIKVHPAADLFPMMSADELKALGADIKKNGLKVPVALWAPGDNEEENEYQLLDGRNRLDAMELVGMQTVIEVGKSGKWELSGLLGGSNYIRGTGGARPILRLREFSKGHALSFGSKAAIGKAVRKPDTDPYAYVISANIHRRHLAADQKRDLIAKVLKLDPSKSNRQIAKIVGVSHPHVGKIRTEMESAGDVETVTTSIDTKGRKQPAKKKRIDDVERDRKACVSLDLKVTAAERELAEWLVDHPREAAVGVPEVPATPEKRTGGLPTGSLSQKTPAPQAAVVETQVQPANPIIAAWEAANLEQAREFSGEHGAAVVDQFMGRGRRSDDPLKYRIYKICDAIELELGDEEELDSEEIAGLRADYKAAVEALRDLEQQISDARAEEEEAEEAEEEEAEAAG